VLTNQQGLIRGLALDTAKNYVFTGGFDDGEIAVFNIEKPGKVKQKIIIYVVQLCKRNKQICLF